MQHIATKEELEALLDQQAVIVMKHSSTCPISAEAYEQFQTFTSNTPNLPAVYLVVQEDRELSTYIAEKYHVKHQSPQVILFKNGNVAWHESHWRITVDALAKAYAE
ncbi:MAG: bacillithiol system redox-active protein YtxJ [Bacillus sp. (in: firmicutes)]